MPKTNLNNFAKEVTLIEKKKIQVSVAQVKEVLKVTFFLLAQMPLEEASAIIARYKTKT